MSILRSHQYVLHVIVVRRWRTLVLRCLLNVGSQQPWQLLLFKLFARNCTTTSANSPKKKRLRGIQTLLSTVKNSLLLNRKRSVNLMNENQLQNLCQISKTTSHTKMFSHQWGLSIITSSCWLCKLKLMLPMPCFSWTVVYVVPSIMIRHLEVKLMESGQVSSSVSPISSGTFYVLYSSLTRLAPK